MTSWNDEKRTFEMNEENEEPPSSDGFIDD
jgi:hypothetical protein